MTISPIDEAILTTVGDRWTKVAMVIGRVSNATGRSLDEVFGHEISTRIHVLVRAGRLEARGDVTNWRFSEIRRAGD